MFSVYFIVKRNSGIKISFLFETLNGLERKRSTSGSRMSTSELPLNADSRQYRSDPQLSSYEDSVNIEFVLGVYVTY